MKIYKLALTILLFTSFISASAFSGKSIISKNGFKPFVSPLLTTKWTQAGGENNLLPYFKDSGKRAVTGCGATAMGQVMKFWNYPTRGDGKNFYLYTYPDGTEEIRSSDFSNTYYDWDNMRDVYYNQSDVTAEELNAIGTLMKDIGIALEMKYKSTSTGTQIEYISSALQVYFGYNPQMSIIRSVNGAYTSEELLTMVYKELSEGRPIIMGGAYQGANHIYVADGYNEDGLIHLNLGHIDRTSSHNTDNYFDITNTGKTYTEDLRMLIGICPHEIEMPMTTFNCTSPGNLIEALGGEKEVSKICRLKITGTIAPSDIEKLREYSLITTGQLSYIDLSNAEIDGGNMPSFYTSSNTSDAKYTLQRIYLPKNTTSISSNAFRNCLGLIEVNFPSTVNSLGQSILYSTRYLKNINIPDATISSENPFRKGKIQKLLSNDYSVINDAWIKQEELICGPILKTGKYVIPEDVETIKNYAFEGAMLLDEVILPSSIKKIDSYAFYDCRNIRNFVVLASNPPRVQQYYFSSFAGNATLHVPAGCKQKYIDAGWTGFADIIEAPAVINKIEILPDTSIIKVGEKTLLSAKITPENATNKSLTWHSSNPDIAVVDSDGIVTALKIGSTTITASANENSEITGKSVVLVVPTLISEITINGKSHNLQLGQTMTLTASILPEDATNTSVNWSTSDSSIATITSSGEVTATNNVENINKTVTIIASAVDASKIEAYYDINIIGIPVDSISISKPTDTMLKDGESTFLTATIFPDNATNKRVTWSSSNEEITTIDGDGKVTAHAKIGTVWIIATADDNKFIMDSISLEVIPTPVADIVINVPSDFTTLEMGHSVQLSATVLPTTATKKDVTWSSSDTSIATVDASGIVTSQNKEGSAIITAYATDGSKTTGSIEIKVNKPSYIPAQSISLDYEDLTISVGSSFQLTATISPTDCTSSDVVWRSSNVKVANVENGIVSALESGSTVITATVYNSDNSSISTTCNVRVIPSSGIETTSTLHPTIIVESMCINVSGITDDQVVEVSTLDGRVLTRAQGPSSIAVDRHNIYLIRIGEIIKKVVVNF